MTFTRLYFLVVSICFFSACYEKEEGCLDIAATNFDVIADKPCPDSCCEYPVINFSVVSVFYNMTDDSSYAFKNDKLFEVPGFPGDSISFSRIRYFISDLELISQGTAYSVTEVLDLYIGNDYVEVSDNFGILQPGNSSSITLGSFPNLGNFDALRFTFGLNEDILLANPDSIPSGHPLSIQNDSTLWVEGIGYQTAYLELFRSQTATDSTIIQVPTSTEVELNFLDPIEITGGLNLTVQVQLDFGSWFVGTDPQNDPISTLQQKIIENVSASFLFLGFN